MVLRGRAGAVSTGIAICRDLENCSISMFGGMFGGIFSGIFSGMFIGRPAAEMTRSSDSTLGFLRQRYLRHSGNDKFKRRSI